MRIHSIALTFVGLVLLGTGIAHAQDAGRVGLTMGYPASFGLVWRVTDGLAIRPEFSFSYTKTDTTTSLSGAMVLGESVPTTSSTKSWQAAGGASALIYLGQSNALRTYVSPRFAYSSSAPSSTSTITVTGSSYTVAGSFGAEYALVRRLSLFGEVGLAHTRTTATSTSELVSGASMRIESTGHAVGLRSGIGVILFF